MKSYKGKIPKKREPETPKSPDLSGSIFGVVALANELQTLKSDLVNTVDTKITEVDETVDEALASLVNASEVLENAKEEVLELVGNIKTGPAGKDADEDLIVERVVERTTVDEEALEARISSKIHRIDEKKLRKDLFNQLDRKTDLKIIQEKIEIDPMSVIDKIMALPTEQLSKLKLRTDNIDGLSQTISAFQSQLGRGYLHGGGASLLTQLNDVTITSVTDGQALVYDEATGKWINGAGGSSSPLTTKGDLYTYSTEDARLPVGTDGYVLVSDSTQTTGLKWIASTGIVETLANVSADSTNATTSLYTMTSTIPVEFRRSAGATLLYFDETNGYMGINTTNPESQLTINTQATNVAAIRIKDAVGGSAADLFIAFNQDNQTTLGWGLGMNAVDNSFNLTYNTSGGSRIDSGQFITALTSGLIGIGQTTPTSKLDITTNSLGVTQTTTSGLALVNTTAASAGAQQISPAIRWSGFGWKTDATAESRSVDFRMDMLPVQAAANPSGLLQIGSSINGGAYTTFYSFTSAGVFGVSNGTSNQITMTGSTARINGGASLANYFYFTPGGYDAGYFTGNTNAGVTAYGFTIGGNSDVYTSGTAGVLRVNRNFGAGAGSGVWRPMSVEYTINNSGVQSGTATGIFLNATETALNSMGHNVMDLQVGGASKLLVTNTGAITINAEYTLPTTDGGANQVLTTDGAGVVTWEDGGGGVPTAITVADEASDTTCFPSFFTAATGDLGPKTNAGLTYNSATGAFAVAPTVSGSLSGTYSILRSAPTYTNSGASNATINGLSIATTVNNSSTGQSNVYGVNMTVAQSDTITTSSNMRGLEFAVTGYKAATMYAILGSANVYNPSGTNASNVIGQYLLVSQSDNPTTFNHGNVTNMYGSYISTVTSIGTVTSQAGFYAASVVNSGGTVTDLHGLRLQTIGISGGSATNVYGIKLDTIYNSSGTITNTYGIYTGDVTNGTQTNQAYNIYLSDANARNYLGGNTTINGNLNYKLTVEPAADDTANGPYTDSINAGATIAAMDCVYLASDGEWALADADAAATSAGMLAIALEAGTDGNPMDVALPGSVIRNDSWAWTPGATIYVSTSVGELTATAPSGTDDVVRVVGFALTDDAIYWNPSNDYITIV